MKERPKSIRSTTQRIETGYGKVYVTLGIGDHGEVFEVFVNTGTSGGYTNSWCNALSMTASVALRSGADPLDVADVLMGVRTDKPAEDNGDTILSIPDAVGVAIKRYVEDKVSESIREEPPEMQMNEAGLELPTTFNGDE